jgi:hypothetical protein
VVVGGGNIPGWGEVALYLNNARLQYSVDGLTWLDLLIVTGVTDAEGNRDIRFSATSGRYWRLFRSGYLATTNFQLFGPG